MINKKNEHKFTTLVCETAKEKKSKGNMNLSNLSGLDWLNFYTFSRQSAISMKRNLTRHGDGSHENQFIKKSALTLYVLIGTP